MRRMAAVFHGKVLPVAGDDGRVDGGGQSLHLPEEALRHLEPHEDILQSAGGQQELLAAAVLHGVSQPVAVEDVVPFGQPDDILGQGGSHQRRRREVPADEKSHDDFDHLDVGVLLQRRPLPRSE